MHVLINGWYHRVTLKNEVMYNGNLIPIVRDVYGNYWVLIAGELIQLNTFKQRGQVIEFPLQMPEFIHKAPVSKLTEGSGFEISELDQYWSLDRKEFYMLVTYRITE
ncbi:hypothetical protein HDF26_002283 [Pedobacter cryoconitis]|uniref:hypothetical protein n=1 Tax=Pedobacter cryoconitis TaxID=188932 RepID=UPI00160A106E|nr:hypothetical protein [Pedobacter cryoconitis]MBB6271826.1 hypothetical protein [Pedobacter cryoconitis]